MSELAAILGRAQVAQISFLDGGRPAIVPMSFGFAVEEGAFALYFHSSGVGRKAECFRLSPAVSVCAVGDNEIVLRDPACRSTCRYESVILDGEVEFLSDPEEKRRGLDLIMVHCGAELPCDYAAEMLERTAVFRIVARSITGKRS